MVNCNGIASEPLILVQFVGYLALNSVKAERIVRLRMTASAYV